MKLELTRGNQQKILLADRDYVAAGGEASIYRKGTEAFKIYHDQKKLPPLAKIQELAALQSSHVICPLDVLYNSTGVPVGYVLRFLDNVTPLCRLFTKAFKIDNAIDAGLIVELVKTMHSTLGDVHRQRCLAVDLNELNILVGATWVESFFIDTDSYQTPHFPATAIMESIRDRKANGRWSEYSDWFSWGVLAFQLYINIHPYKGSHPKYKPNEWSRRMDDGISVFDKHVKLPSVCNPLTSIPKRHRDWFEAVFARGERSVPPLPDASTPVAVAQQFVAVQNTDGFTIDRIYTYDSRIQFQLNSFGISYVVTEQSVYRNQAIIFDRATFDRPHWKHVYVTVSAEGDPVIILSAPLTHFLLPDTHAGGKSIGTVASTGACFIRNNAVYTVAHGKLMENTFRKLGSKIIHQVKDVQSITNIAFQVFDGVVVQDLLGKKWLSIPYAPGRCLNKPVPNLDSTMKLFNHGGSVYFINHDSIYQVKTR